MNKIGVLRFILIVMVSFGLSACSAYKSKFRCGEASGLSCTMLSEIDRQISSGEIEEVEKQKKCKGRNCEARSKQNKKLPKLKQDRNLELLMINNGPNDEDEILEEFVVETKEIN